MTSTDLPYDHWLEDALRGVIRRALSYCAENGLPGTHHFYLTFKTAADGVELTPELHAKYPDEMTIVLQHQFWDLSVDDERIAVTLKFRGRPSRLVIPLAAVTAFGDPSVNFGLQLKLLEVDAPTSSETAESDDAVEAAPRQKPGDAEVIALDTFRKK